LLPQLAFRKPAPQQKAEAACTYLGQKQENTTHRAMPRDLLQHNPCSLLQRNP